MSSGRLTQERRLRFPSFRVLRGLTRWRLLNRQHIINALFSFRGKPIKYLKGIETERGFEEVSEEEIIKGYEHARGHHVLIEPEEIDALRLEAKHTIDMTRFVDLDRVVDAGLTAMLVQLEASRQAEADRRAKIKLVED